MLHDNNVLTAKNVLPAQYLIIPSKGAGFEVFSIVYKKGGWATAEEYYSEFRNFVAEVPTWDEATRIVEKMKEGGF